MDKPALCVIKVLDPMSKRFGTYNFIHIGYFLTFRFFDEQSKYIESPKRIKFQKASRKARKQKYDLSGSVALAEWQRSVYVGIFD